MNRSLRTLSASIAVFAMLLQGLWPLIAQARPAAPGLLVLVCTIDGVTHYIDLAPGDTPLEKRSALHHGHCPLCATGGDRVTALPAAPVLVLAVESPSAAVPVRYAVASPEAPSHSPAQPRAPPALS